MITKFPEEQYFEIAAGLEDYHTIFYEFMGMANVAFSDEIATACIRFYPVAKPDMLINEEFWNARTYREKLFIIVHECLHVILLHDERNGQDIPGATPRLINVAQDITINEMAVYLFGFDRNELRDWKKFCWIDTCFDDPSVIEKNQTFEYYLKLLIEQGKSDLPETLDDHGESGSAGNSESQAKREKIAETLAENLSAEELESVLAACPDSGGALNVTGNYDAIIGDKRNRAKVHFSKLVKNVKKTRIKMIESSTDTFIRENRRYSEITRSGELVLPGQIESLKPSKDKLLIAMFQDISGSCYPYFKTFDRIHSAFSHEKELFEIRSFVFDKVVTEIEIGDKVKAGGATVFTILEKKVQELRAEYGKYPDCVIVVTDGDVAEDDGRKFSPAAPSRWIWMLTEDPVVKYIPHNSKKFMIAQVVF